MALPTREDLVKMDYSYNGAFVYIPAKSTTSLYGMDYYCCGAPFVSNPIGSSGPTSAIKTVTGLAKASVKTVNGLAIASVKTWGGLA